MPSLVKSALAEAVLRQCLIGKGFSLSPLRSNGETGADIIAKTGNVKFYIEVIGFKSSPPARSKDFYESFFRAVSRLNNDADKCIIALPSRFENGLRQRAKQHHKAWARIANAFPELEIWLINTDEPSYQITAWGYWL